jgi:gliding motility-associated lipoprotein GldD
MRMKRFCYIFSAFASAFISCNDYTPKPTGYPRIDRQESQPLRYSHPEFSFSYPSEAEVKEVERESNRGFWFNITYPAYDAVIYCTYLPVNKTILPKAIEDSYRLAYSQSAKADAIVQTPFADSSKHTVGIIYDIKGSVASPVQFYITDDNTGFLRGSLYFEQAVKPDSVAPVVAFLRKDIADMMKSLEWRKKKSSG